MRSTLAVRKLMLFLFQQKLERNNGIEMKGEFVRRIAWWSMTMFVLGIVSHFSSPSPGINSYGYDSDVIVSTKIEKVSWIYVEVQLETKLKFCVYQVAYSVTALKHLKTLRVWRCRFCYKKFKNTIINVPFKRGNMYDDLTEPIKFYDRRAKLLMSRSIVKYPWQKMVAKALCVRSL